MLHGQHELGPDHFIYLDDCQSHDNTHLCFGRDPIQDPGHLAIPVPHPPVIPIHPVALPYSPAQSPLRGLSASSSVGDAGILVGSHGHFGSLQTQSPAKKTRPISQVSMGSQKHLKHFQMTSKTAKRVSVAGGRNHFPTCI